MTHHHDNCGPHRLDHSTAGQVAREGAVVSLRTEHPTPDLHVVSAAGELDLLTTPQFRAHLADTLDNGTKILVLDLSEIHYLGSVGLAALIATHNSATERGIDVYIIGSRAVRRLLTVSGLLDHLDIVEGLDTVVSGRQRG